MHYLMMISRGGQYRVQKYRGTFLVPIPAPTVLFQNWYQSTGTTVLLKKVFGMFSFSLFRIN